jgi:hypothetical protein
MNLLETNNMFENLNSALEVSVAKPNPKRKQVQDFIITHINKLDPSGMNGKRYEEMFSKWSDTEFHSYMSGMREGVHKIVLYVPNLKINLKMKDIFEVSHDLGLELFEQLRLWDSTTKRYYLTPQKYPILLLPVRRLKQFLMDKISVPESDTKIDSFTGQVVKPDKGASISSVEMQTILSKGLKTSISELIRVRGGDLAAYASFKSQLEETGTASLNELPEDSRARSSVIMSTYLFSMHIDNNV